MDACCAVGLKLVSLHQVFKFQSIPAAAKSRSRIYFLFSSYLTALIDTFQIADGSVQPGSFWTSATDQGCEDSFGYCSTNRLVREEAR